MFTSINLGLTAAACRDAGIAPAAAQKKYDNGANDKEIKIGHIGPYSGPPPPTGPSATPSKPTSTR